MTPWQWFLAHGDKLLTGISASILALVAAGVIPHNAAWVGAVTGVLGVLHTAFFPEPNPVQQGSSVGGIGAAPPGAPKQGGKASVGLLIALALFAVTIPTTVALTGCQALGLAPAQSLDQKLAYGYGVYTAVQQAAASATTSGTLSKEDAGYVLKICDEARTFLDSARSIEASDPNGAASKLTLATAVLTQVQNYLQSRGIK